MITKAGAYVGKFSSKYTLVVNTKLLSHYGRGYKPLKAVNTCHYTDRILSGRHVFISRNVPQSVVSLFLTYKSQLLQGFENISPKTNNLFNSRKLRVFR